MNRTIISKLNGWRFVEEGVEVSQEYYNHLSFDYTPYLDQIKGWESKVNYRQLAQTNDPFALQILVKAGSSAEVRVYDCHGVRVNPTPIPMMMSIPTNAPSVTIGSDIMNYLSFFKHDFFDQIASGVYHVVIRVVYPTNDVVEFYSEPIWLKEKHKGSYLISYKNRYNKDYVLFEQTGKRFHMRMPADLAYVPSGDKVVFEDQQRNSFLLSGRAKSNWELTIGGSGKYIPDYAIDIINHIFHVDDIKIDGKSYSVIESSELEVSKIEGYPLRSVSILLGERTLVNERFVIGDTTLPSTPLPPFILAPPLTNVPNIRVTPVLNVGNDLTEVIGNDRTTTTASENGSYLQYLNNLVQTQTALKGNFTFVTAGLQFNPAIGDMVDNGHGEVLTDAIAIRVNIPNGTETIYGDIKINGGSHFAITEGLDNPFYSKKYSESFKDQFKHELNAGEKTLYFWGGGGSDVKLFELSNFKINNGTLSLVGAIETPNFQLEKFSIRDSDIEINTNIYEILNNSKSSLETLELVNVGLTYLGLMPDNFTRLKYIYLSDNNISQNNASSIVGDIYDNVKTSFYKTGEYITNGVIDFRNNPLSTLNVGVISKAKELQDVYGWRIMLFSDNAIDLGEVPNGSIYLSDVNICGVYEYVGLAFDSTNDMLNWLNANYVIDNSLIGLFILTSDRRVIYTNEDDLCQSGFLNTSTSIDTIFITQESSYNENDINFTYFVTQDGEFSFFYDEIETTPVADVTII